MAMVTALGGWMMTLGGPIINQENPPTPSSIGTVDAVNEAVQWIGNLIWADGGSHTVNTTGSSSISWKTGTVTWASGTTVVKVGIASVDAAAGPPARATNSANVITFDVNATHVGGDASLTSSAWITSVPNTGTKTIANGDLVAICVQMTARGGTDSVIVTSYSTASSYNRPTTTNYLTAVYSAATNVPICVVKASDGTIGWLYGAEVAGTSGTKTWSNANLPNEYGTLFDMPFGYKVYGIYSWVDPDGNLSFNLYSDPLGTPVAERTISVDLNQVALGQHRRFVAAFSSPYTVKPNQKIVASVLPEGTAINMLYTTLGDAAYRVAYAYGTRGYGCARSSLFDPFASENSDKDVFPIGLLVGGFEHPAKSSFGLGM